MPRLGLDEARDLTSRAFRKAGVGLDAADAAAEVIVLAEAFGLKGHGLVRVADYLGRIAASGIEASADPRVTFVAPALRLVDGGHGVGPSTARLALAEAIDAAGQFGIGAAFCRRGAHVGALAPYLWIAAEAGFASVMTTSTAPMISPAGGVGARIGNSPIGLGVPHPDGAHLLLDMSLSMVSRSRIRAAARAGETIPETWANDANGLPTSDPARALAGILQAIGGDKGATLALSLDLFASVLGGAAMLSEIPAAVDDPGARQDLGCFVLAIDANALASDEMRRDRLSDAAAILAATPTRETGTLPRLPGARAIAALEVARREGLEVSEDVLRTLKPASG